MYILVENRNRDLNVDVFENLEDAQKAMFKRFTEAGTSKTDEEMYSDWEAYKNDANNHDNYDWKIIVHTYTEKPKCKPMPHIQKIFQLAKKQFTQETGITNEEYEKMTQDFLKTVVKPDFQWDLGGKEFERMVLSYMNNFATSWNLFGSLRIGDLLIEFIQESNCGENEDQVSMYCNVFLYGKGCYGITQNDASYGLLDETLFDQINTCLSKFKKDSYISFENFKNNFEYELMNYLTKDKTKYYDSTLFDYAIKPTKTKEDWKVK